MDSPEPIALPRPVPARTRRADQDHECPKAARPEDPIPRTATTCQLSRVWRGMSTQVGFLRAKMEAPVQISFGGKVGEVSVCSPRSVGKVRWLDVLFGSCSAHNPDYFSPRPGNLPAG